MEDMFIMKKRQVEWVKSSKKYTIKETKKTREQELEDLADLFTEYGIDSPIATTPSNKNKSSDNNTQSDVRRNKSSQSDTLDASKNVRLNNKANDMIKNMKNIEPDPDDKGYPRQDTQKVTKQSGYEDRPETPLLGGSSLTRTTHENLPDVVGKELMDAGYVNPNWHQVANLPGNMSTAIRTLGKKLFSAFTTTPVENIWTVANLAGQGPNTYREVNSVAAWISSTGAFINDVNIDFETTIPGYNAEVKLYDAAGVRWMLVKDEFGIYIYSWPVYESKNYSPTKKISI